MRSLIAIFLSMLPFTASAEAVSLATGDSAVACYSGDNITKALRNLNAALSADSIQTSASNGPDNRNALTVIVSKPYGVSAPTVISESPTSKTVCVTLTKQ